MVRLSREVCSEGIVGLWGLERRVTQVAPKDREQPVAVCFGKQRAYLADLPCGLLRAVVDRGTHSHGSKLDGLMNRSEWHLVAAVGVGEKFTVVQLDDHRNLVGIAAGDDREAPERRGKRAAVGSEGQLGKILRVEVDRVLGEARRRRMLDPLVDRQDRQVPGATEAAVVEQLLQVAQNRHGPVAVDEDPVDKVRSGERELVALDRLALVAEQGVSLVPERLADVDSHCVVPPGQRVSAEPIPPVRGRVLRRTSRRRFRPRPLGRSCGDPSPSHYRVIKPARTTRL